MPDDSRASWSALFRHGGQPIAQGAPQCSLELVGLNPLQGNLADFTPPAGALSAAGCRSGNAAASRWLTRAWTSGRRLDDHLRGSLVGRHPNTGNYAVVIPQGIGRGGGLSLRTWVELHHEPALCPDSFAKMKTRRSPGPTKGIL